MIKTHPKEGLNYIRLSKKRDEVSNSKPPADSECSGCAFVIFVNIGESYCLSTSRVFGREAITPSYIYNLTIFSASSHVKEDSAPLTILMKQQYQLFVFSVAVDSSL